MRKRRNLPVGQLQFDFSPHLPVEADPIVYDLAWRDVTVIAKGAGISGDCLVSTTLYEQLDEQALYDALWTANFTLSLGDNRVVPFTLELNQKEIQFKVIQNNCAVRLDCAKDF